MITDERRAAILKQAETSDDVHLKIAAMLMCDGSDAHERVMGEIHRCVGRPEMVANLFLYAAHADPMGRQEWMNFAKMKIMEDAARYIVITWFQFGLVWGMIKALSHFVAAPHANDQMVRKLWDTILELCFDERLKLPLHADKLKQPVGDSSDPLVEMRRDINQAIRDNRTGSLPEIIRQALVRWDAGGRANALGLHILQTIFAHRFFQLDACGQAAALCPPMLYSFSLNANGPDLPGSATVIARDESEAREALLSSPELLHRVSTDEPFVGPIKVGTVISVF